MCFVCINVILSAITCDTLDPLTNGSIVYSEDGDDTAPYHFESIANYSCNPVSLSKVVILPEPVQVMELVQLEHLMDQLPLVLVSVSFVVL